MKTTNFIAITIVALGVIGVTAAGMSSAIPVHAQGGATCHVSGGATNGKTSICPPGSDTPNPYNPPNGAYLCTSGGAGCKPIGGPNH